MKAHAEIERKYYKYVIVESVFVRPNLSSNGTLGGENFAVTSYTFPWTGKAGAYYMFDGKTSTQCNSTAHRGTGYVIWYNPKPLKVTNVVCGAGYSGDWFDVTFSGSDDGTNWIDIAYFDHGVRTDCPVNSPNFYKYWRMYNNTGFHHDGSGYGGGISEVYITGIEKVESIVESDETDYDFYKDAISTSLIKKIENDTDEYFAIKSYEKGQYYGN